MVELVNTEGHDLAGDGLFGQHEGVDTGKVDCKLADVLGDFGVIKLGAQRPEWLK